METEKSDAEEGSEKDEIEEDGLEGVSEESEDIRRCNDVGETRGGKGIQGGENRWKPVVSHLQRRFEKGACVCCKGGNCHLLGHQGECKCSCLPRSSNKPVLARDLREATEFKKAYVNNEKKQTREVSTEEQEVAMTATILQTTIQERWLEEVEEKLETRLDEARQKGIEGDEEVSWNRWLKWANYRRRQEDSQMRCRRFQATRNGSF